MISDHTQAASVAWEPDASGIVALRQCRWQWAALAVAVPVLAIACGLKKSGSDRDWPSFQVSLGSAGAPGALPAALASFSTGSLSLRLCLEDRNRRQVTQ